VRPSPLVTDPVFEVVEPTRKHRAEARDQAVGVLERRGPHVLLADPIKVPARAGIGAGGVDEVRELREACAGELRRAIDHDLSAARKRDHALAGRQPAPVGRVEDDGVALDVEPVHVAAVDERREGVARGRLRGAEPPRNLARGRDRSFLGL